MQLKSRKKTMQFPRRVILQAFCCLLWTAFAYHSSFVQRSPITTSLHLQPTKDVHVIAENRKSSHDYEFTETYEAGIQLLGTEVKSCRKNMVQLTEAIAEIR